MKKCVRCEKLTGAYEINGELVCNVCYQDLVEKARANGLNLLTRKEKPKPWSEDMENTSGRGKTVEVPSVIKKWNWGAFFLNWIWGLSNETLIALLMFIPLVNIVMPFVLGANGSEWAWKNKRWKSVHHFKTVQKKWAWWGLGVWIFGLIMAIISAI